MVIGAGPFAGPWVGCGGQHYRLTNMKLVRELERRLEAALDGLAGRIFRGDLHASELAARVARAAELAEYSTPAGPATANKFYLTLHTSHLAGSAAEMETELATAFADYAANRGWRLEGPTRVVIATSPVAAVGVVGCRAEVAPGPLSAWAHLQRGAGLAPLPISHNRCLLGRATDCDVIIDAAEVSRHHALIFRQDGQAFVVDLHSVNGTFVDGQRVGSQPARIHNGSPLAFADVRLRFVTATHA
jgi:hypothetical protein